MCRYPFSLYVCCKPSSFTITELIWTCNQYILDIETVLIMMFGYRQRPKPVMFHTTDPVSLAVHGLSV